MRGYQKTRISPLKDRKMEQRVLYSVKEGIGRIVINRPKEKALNMRTRQRLIEIMDEIARDENIRSWSSRAQVRRPLFQAGSTAE
jgi:1,4-dihydroxy-2-naphthoyl-CoA synthase